MWESRRYSLEACLRQSTMTDVTFTFFDVGEPFHLLCTCSDELKRQWEARVAQERAAMQEEQAKEMQVTRLL